MRRWCIPADACVAAVRDATDHGLGRVCYTFESPSWPGKPAPGPAPSGEPRHTGGPQTRSVTCEIDEPLIVAMARAGIPNTARLIKAHLTTEAGLHCLFAWDDPPSTAYQPGLKELPPETSSGGAPDGAPKAAGPGWTEEVVTDETAPGAPREKIHLFPAAEWEYLALDVYRHGPAGRLLYHRPGRGWVLLSPPASGWTERPVSDAAFGTWSLTLGHEWDRLRPGSEVYLNSKTGEVIRWEPGGRLWFLMTPQAEPEPAKETPAPPAALPGRLAWDEAPRHDDEALLTLALPVGFYGVSVPDGRNGIRMQRRKWVEVYQQLRQWFEPVSPDSGPVPSALLWDEALVSEGQVFASPEQYERFVCYRHRKTGQLYRDQVPGPGLLRMNPRLPHPPSPDSGTSTVELVRMERSGNGWKFTGPEGTARPTAEELRGPTDQDLDLMFAIIDKAIKECQSTNKPAWYSLPSARKLTEEEVATIQAAAAQQQPLRPWPRHLPKLEVVPGTISGFLTPTPEGVKFFEELHGRVICTTTPLKGSHPLSLTGEQKEELAASLRAAGAPGLPPVEPPRWRPMETAPKDGSCFLAWFPDLIEATSTQWSGGKWRTADGIYRGAPTCWQPLPEAPAT